MPLGIPMARTTIFVSYSHRDRKLMNRLKTHLEPYLGDSGLHVWDDTMIRPGMAWRSAIRLAIRSAKVAVMLVSPDFLASRFIMEEELPPLLENAERDGLQVLWIAASASSYEVTELDDFQCVNEPARPLNSLAPWELDAELVRICRVISDVAKGTKYSTPEFTLRSRRVFRPDCFVNRENELQKLDAYWKDPAKRVVTIVAAGGVGKSAVVEHWLENRESKADPRVALIRWSFYGQQDGDDQERSSDAFFDFALRTLEPLQQRPTGASAKCERLLRIADGRCLLFFLDGIETLQFSDGRIRDLALERFIDGLAAPKKHPLKDPRASFCVLTTQRRLRGHETASKLDHDQSLGEIQLERLTDDSGAALLRLFDIDGSYDDLKEASKAFEGHPLSLSLLASYLHRECNGDISGSIRFKRNVPWDGAQPADSILFEYEATQTTNGERDILRLLSLIDFPIPDVTLQEMGREVLAMSRHDLGKSLRRLAREGLVRRLQGPRRREVHPAVRKYFAARLRNNDPLRWHELHQQLGRFYEKLHLRQPKGIRDVSEQLPLVNAIRHYCEAGRFRRAFLLYWNDLIRGPQHSSFRDRPFQAESIPELIECLKSFFDDTWKFRLDGPCKQPFEETNVGDDIRIRLQEEAGHYLFVSGRLTDAIGLLSESLIQRTLRRGEVDYYEAARHARMAAELLIAKGDLLQAVDFVGKCSNAAMNLVPRPTDSDKQDPQPEHGSELPPGHKSKALAVAAQLSASAIQSQLAFHRGDIVLAIRAIKEAEDLIREAEKRVLTSYYGYWLCDLLVHVAMTMNQGATELWRHICFRAQHILNEARDRRWLISQGHGHLLRGISTVFIGKADSPIPNFGKSVDDFDIGISRLRSSGEQHHLIRGLLFRSRMIDHLRGFHLIPFPGWSEAREQAECEVNEALKLANRHGMFLLAVDAHIELAKLKCGDISCATGRGVAKAKKDAQEYLAKVLGELAGIKGEYLRQYSTLARLSRECDFQLPKEFRGRKDPRFKIVKVKGSEGLKLATADTDSLKSVELPLILED